MILVVYNTTDGFLALSPHLYILKIVYKTIPTWKKEVWDGSRPVLPGGTTTSIGATRPTRAGAPTCENQIQQNF